MREPVVLDPDRFPVAERCAMRLDGDCVDLGLTAVPVDEPVGPALRAATLAAAAGRYDLVADGWTAAWVHGAWPVLPGTPTFGVDVRTGRRTRAVHPPPRETRFSPGDVERLGGVRATTPARTAFDLLVRSPGPVTDAVVVRLLADARLPAGAAVAAAETAPSCAGKRDAVARLRELVAPRPGTGGAPSGGGVSPR